MVRTNRKIRRILVTTMPRSGTHFLWDFMSRLYGFKKVEPIFTGGFRPKPPEWDAYKFDQSYLNLKDNEVLGCAHYLLNHEIRELLEDDELLCLYLYRDPRDVAVSAALYIKYGLVNHFLHPLFTKLTDSEAILFYINGGIVSPCDLPRDTDLTTAPYVVFEGMEFHCKNSYPWLLHPRVAKIRYEEFTRNNLVLCESLQRVGVEISPSRVEEVSKEMNFSKAAKGREIGAEDKASHFRKGIIGDHKNYYGDIHRAICKFRIGEDLIRLGYEKGYNW